MLINVFFSKLVSKLSGEICPCGDYNACLKLSVADKQLSFLSE